MPAIWACRAVLVTGLTGVIEDRSSSQASSAFWACSRFSASSQTTLRGPSITAAVISSPRCAGRQCSTTQPDPARPSFSSSSW